MEEYTDRFIDFNIEVDTDSELYKVIQKFSLEQSSKLQGRKDSIRRQADAMVIIILNLMRGYDAYRITLKKTKTDKSTRYTSTIYRSNYRKKALEFLESIGFCKYLLGSWEDKRETNVYPTSKVLSYFAQYGPIPYNIKVEETIVIKDVDYSTSFTGIKFKVLYDDDYRTNYLRDTLETINNSIKVLDISYPEYFKEGDCISDINQHLSNYCGYHPLIPLIGGQLYLCDRFTSLFRVFNDRSTGSGGRMFGGPWINMKKAQRKHMTINGKNCSIVDYNSMSIMQLDARDGRTIYDDYDNYTIPGLKNVGRTVIKKQIQRMINSEIMPKSFRSKDKSIAKGFKGVNFDFANKAILKHLSRISHHFGTGIGKRLMNEESFILIRVLQKLMRLNIPALPLHDAVITTNRYAKKVKEIMEETFDEYYSTIGATADIETL